MDTKMLEEIIKLNDVLTIFYNQSTIAKQNLVNNPHPGKYDGGDSVAYEKKLTDHKSAQDLYNHHNKLLSVIKDRLRELEFELLNYNTNKTNLDMLKSDIREMDSKQFTDFVCNLTSLSGIDMPYDSIKLLIEWLDDTWDEHESPQDWIQSRDT